MTKARTLLTAGIATAIVVLGYSAHVVATAVTGQNASATIVTPITVTPGAALNFGTVSNDPVLTSTVTLDPTTNGAAGANGASVFAGTFTRADFALTAGVASAAYTVTFTVPGDITASGCGACPANSVVINTLTWDSAGGGTLDAAGADTLWIGGTLTMTPAAAAGAYSGTYDMNVIYN